MNTSPAYFHRSCPPRPPERTRGLRARTASSRERFAVALCLAVSLGCLGAPSHSRAQPANAEFAKLLEESWEFNLRQSPIWATTQVGDSRYADRLPDVTLAAEQRRHEVKREFLRRAQAIDDALLTQSERVNLRIFTRLLKDDLSEYQFESHLIPITNRWGFHIAFPELPKQLRFQRVADYENYLMRLEAFGKYTDDHLALMRSGIAAGQVLPAVVLEGFAETIRPHIVEDPEQSLFYAPLAAFPELVSERVRAPLRNRARKAIREVVVPAYGRFLKFMTEEYVPAARGSIAASALPQGRDFYRYRVRHFTTLDVTPDEVHSTGLAEVARIRGEMEAIPAKVDFKGGYAEFLEFLRSDPRFYPQSAKELQMEVALILKRMDGKLPELFGKLPRTPYGLKPVPDYVAPRTTSAYYSLPAADGSRAGFFFINTYNLKSRPLYEMEALSLHEAVPGHHLQLALQQELTGLPAFRRFASFTAFVEGWALYAERLGLEVGFYEDPYSDFGRLSFEMWRACRLVVDTGIHWKGWTRQRAIQYMAENTALSLHNIEAEVDRYISWPGQALAYKMGELKIRELRRTAESKLGAAFDLREFHDVVLANGSVPLAVLEQNVQAYLAERMRQPPPQSSAAPR